VNLYFRMLWLSIRSRRWPRLGFFDVGRVTFRVTLGDLDVLRHMNNGRYLTLMDLGRLDLMRRSGMWDALNARGWYPVIVAETITFRRSLELGQQFSLESRLRGVDAKAVYLEQRFVVDGQIYAQAEIRARFLKKTGGTVSISELAELVGGLPDDLAVPQWITDWSEATALPPSRAEAPSIW